MKAKQWLIIIFSFALTADILLAIDLYTNLVLVALAGLSVSLVVACLVARPDRPITRRIRRWYAALMYGAPNSK